MTNREAVLSVLSKDIWQSNNEVAVKLGWRYPTGWPKGEAVGQVTLILRKEGLAESRKRKGIENEWRLL